ncbi:TPA: hypothetical protein QEM72_002672 [Pseudomonas putida]|uniref:hypothetical protein n=1 Tax=Pseudomonas putida TaxID=303 RepID=UPI0023643F09|nr:hypothetical protein [Pseudomonas putida]MDD2076408.1 hypothetical protein [Pseudomonas putida]HDS1692168.1 hypothetical protein [Pseudomonas putida]
MNKEFYRSLSGILFVGLLGMLVIANVAIYQRDEASRVSAEVDGRKLICRFEEKR